MGLFLSFSINLITSDTSSLSLYSPFILLKFSCRFFEANISLYALSKRLNSSFLWVNNLSLSIKEELSSFIFKSKSVINLSLAFNSLNLSKKGMNDSYLAISFSFSENLLDSAFSMLNSFSLPSKSCSFLLKASFNFIELINSSMTFSIDSKLLSGNVNSAIFPGSDGSFQILKNHAPIVSTLKKGEIIIDGEISLEDNTSKDLYDIKKDKKKISLNIESGLVEMKRNSIKVLIN